MERIDWNRLWQEYCAEEEMKEDRAFWDEFAPSYRKKRAAGEDPYVEQFYEYSGFEPGETIFDMGCASGTLAIPFAEKGHEVYAADFSPEMLKQLMAGAQEAGVSERIHPIRLDWNEDWTARPDLPLCDVALSSRSFITRDLAGAIRKLESVARRRVCIGAWDEPAKGYDRYAARYIGYERPGYSCYFFIMNELMDRDLFPELHFIRQSFRLRRYESREDALRTQTAAFQYGLTDEQMQRLEQYIEEHLVRCDEAGRQYWRLDHSDESTIAHIRWDVR
ncbi:MAG: class I SAM-dependent methyltransferase [Firmicutes bacterium]|nr:class I SAM-dependent methyltransferase [Bacillota bacterium]